MDPQIAEAFKKMTEAIAALAVNQASTQTTTTSNADTSASLFDRVLSRLETFEHDAEDGHTFARWWERFGDFIKEEGLSDDQRRRLVLTKLSSKFYNQYTEGLLPKTFDDLDFQETLAHLKTQFGDSKSIFVRRFEAFKLKCGQNQDPIAFAIDVNSSCERSELSKATSEEIKCLIYLSGLADDRFDLKHKALKLLEDWRAAKKEIKFTTLIEECRSYVKIQSNVSAFSSSSIKTPHQVNPIFNRPQKLTAQRGGFSQKGRDDTQSSKPREPCHRCGGQHWSDQCRFPKEIICNFCKKPGHIAKICWKRQTSDTHPQHVVQLLGVVDAETEDRADFIHVPLNINGKQVSLMLDTGAQVTIISSKLWQYLGQPKLNQTSIKAQGLNAPAFDFQGSFEASVDRGGPTVTLTCYVGEETSPDLLGTPWIKALWNDGLAALFATEFGPSFAALVAAHFGSATNIKGSSTVSNGSSTGDIAQRGSQSSSTQFAGSRSKSNTRHSNQTESRGSTTFNSGTEAAHHGSPSINSDTTSTGNEGSSTFLPHNAEMSSHGSAAPTFLCGYDYDAYYATEEPIVKTQKERPW
jgi:hypothetical protein